MVHHLLLHNHGLVNIDLFTWLLKLRLVSLIRNTKNCIQFCVYVMKMTPKEILPKPLWTLKGSCVNSWVFTPQLVSQLPRALRGLISLHTLGLNQWTFKQSQKEFNGGERDMTCKPWASYGQGGCSLFHWLCIASKHVTKLLSLEKLPV